MQPLPLNAMRASWLARLELAWHWRYAIAVISVTIALMLTLSLPVIRTGSPFMFFFLAITVTALVGGIRPGLLALVLSLLVVIYWVLPPIRSFMLSQENLFRVIGFVVTASLIASLAHILNRSHRTIYEQAEWLQITLSSIGDAVIATDLEGKVVWQNAVAASLTGWPSDEVVSKPLDKIFRIVNEQTRQTVESPVDHVLAKGHTVALANQTILIAKDGVERPIEDSAAPIRDAKGKIMGVLLILHDVGERRAREIALQATEARLQMALRAGRMVAWEWNVPRGEIWTSDNFAEIYGTTIQYTSEGQQLLHPDDVVGHQQAVQRAANGSDAYHVEFRIVRPDDGRVVWIEEWGFAIPPELDATVTANGEKRVAGLSVDITGRKVADEEIRRLNTELSQRLQELQAVFDLALVGIGVALDPSCKVMVRNQILADWLGVPKGPGASKSSEAADHLPFRMLQNGQDVPASELPLQRAVAERRSIVNQELELVRNDGFRVTVMVSTRPIFDERGEVVGCVGIYVDISERKAAEVALQHMNETLEQRVAERTAELEQINQELVEFTNVVSHDLRAPLRAVTTLSEWVSEEADAILPARVKDYLVKMRLRIDRMENLLNDLTAFTRAGRMHYPREKVDTGVLVKDIIQLLDAPTGFRATVVEPMPIFVTERIPLETVLRNLIGNVLKHHPHPNRGEVTVLTHDLGSWIEFRVRDNGAGIAPESRARIFGIFQTLRPRDEVEGSGMGLAIAKRLVEGRGGYIGVESRLGEGSTFSFTWPKA